MNNRDERLRSLLGDSGWRAALHIITSRTFDPKDARLWAHVDLQKGSLWFKRILPGTWSSTEELMLRAAWSLFNQDTRINLYGLMNRLSDYQFRTVVDAMLCFRSGTYVPKAGLLHRGEKRTLDEIEWQDFEDARKALPEDHEH